MLNCRAGRVRAGSQSCHQTAASPSGGKPHQVADAFIRFLGDDFDVVGVVADGQTLIEFATGCSRISSLPCRSERPERHRGHDRNTPATSDRPHRAGHGQPRWHARTQSARRRCFGVFCPRRKGLTPAPMLLRLTGRSTDASAQRKPWRLIRQRSSSTTKIDQRPSGFRSTERCRIAGDWAHC